MFLKCFGREISQLATNVLEWGPNPRLFACAQLFQLIAHKAVEQLHVQGEFRNWLWAIMVSISPSREREIKPQMHAKRSGNDKHRNLNHVSRVVVAIHGKTRHGCYWTNDGLNHDICLVHSQPQLGGGGCACDVSHKRVSLTQARAFCIFILLKILVHFCMRLFET